VGATTREGEFKSRLLDQAALKPDQRVLDLGCGTGTRDNATGALPEIFEHGGLQDAAETDRLRTVFGTLAFYRARKPFEHSPAFPAGGLGRERGGQPASR
jgi:hypothetical protein